MNHDEEPPLAGYPNNYEAAFIDPMIRIGDSDRKRITEYGARLTKSDTVLVPVL